MVASQTKFLMTDNSKLLRMLTVFVQVGEALG
jgi:hypothetical protein